MKRLLAILAVLIGSGILFGAQGAALPANGGFETDADGDGVPDGWQFKPPKGRGMPVLDAAQFMDGKRSIRLENKGDIGTTYVECIQSVPVKPLVRYTFNSHYRTGDVLGSVAASLYLHDKKGKFLAVWHFYITKKTPDWTPFSKEFLTPMDAVELRLHLRQRAKGTVWWDSIEIREEGRMKQWLGPFQNQNKLVALKPGEAEKRRAKAAFVAEDSVFAVKSQDRCVKDETALDGFSARVPPDAPPYFYCSLKILDVHGRFFENIWPGLKYEICVKVRVKKKAELGTAFRCGVYDSNRLQYVIRDMRPDAADVPDNVWVTYVMGAFVAEKGRLAYVGPTGNQANISEIWVDHFFFVPADEASTKLCADIMKLGDKVAKFCFAGDTAASTAMLLDGDAALKLAYLLRPDPLGRAADDAFCGIVLDYALPDGGWKRVALPVGAVGRDIAAGKGPDFPWRSGRIDSVVRPEVKGAPGEYQTISIPLKKYAPDNWKGNVWVAFAQNNSLETWTGVIKAPLLDSMKALEFRRAADKGDFSGFDKKSSNYLLNSAKNSRKSKFFESLKKSAGPKK